MNWNSLEEFFAMGGYGFYVWGSFLACAVLMVIEPLMAIARQRAALRGLANLGVGNCLADADVHGGSVSIWSGSACLAGCGAGGRFRCHA